MDSETSADVSVDTKEINWIKIEKESKAFMGTMGALWGAAGGALLGGLAGIGIGLIVKPESEYGISGYMGLGVIVGGILGGIVLGTSAIHNRKKIQYYIHCLDIPDYCV